MFRRLHAPALLLVGLFIVLVGAGFTGSSFDVLPSTTPGVLLSDGGVVAGTARLNRPDDWAVLTPMAIAQAYHDPAFPVVNSNLGSGGHNMLVVGMQGVPVAHVSALAKPATWGFFLFDLKRGLAWQWWMPVFGCLFALWGVFNLLVPGRAGLALAASMVFVTSAHVAGWSNWPAYTVFFPAAGLWLTHAMLSMRRWWQCALAGALLGLTLAGFVLILYPPWQVSVGYLFLAVTTGLTWRDRLWEHAGARFIAGLLLALLVAFLVLHAWWSGAAAAVRAVQATVYPGERVATSGGGIPWWQWVEGYLNHHTLYSQGAPGTNPSESASFLYVFPVAVLALAARYGRRLLGVPVELALALFGLWVMWYQLVGLPPLLAQLTLWGRVPDYRADLSFGLASLMLAALILAQPPQKDLRRRALGAAVGAVWAASVAWGLFTTPSPAAGPLSVFTWVPGAIAAFLLAYWLWVRNARAFFACSLLVACVAFVPFNPLSRSPGTLESRHGVMGATDLRNERVLVVGRHIEAMALLASGVAVTNGVFYYPPRALWQALDPAGRYVRKTNRFQHLVFLPEHLPNDTDYAVESPQDDLVVVKIDPARFDFSRTPSTLVLAPADADFSGNATLEEVAHRDGYRLYRVQSTTTLPQ